MFYIRRFLLILQLHIILHSKISYNTKQFDKPFKFMSNECNFLLRTCDHKERVQHFQNLEKTNMRQKI